MKFPIALLTVGTLLVVAVGCQKDSIPPAPKVNAGTSQTTTLPKDSVTLSGTATATSKITAYLWSEVSGPNVPVIADEGSATTMVRGLITGNYIFQLMAVDSMGETGVDTVSVTVLKGAGPVTDTLHTSFGGITPYELNFLANPTYSTAGSSSTPELLVEDWTINGIEVWGRNYMKFDLSKIPANTTIKSAILKLYTDSVPNNGDLIHANSGTNNDFYIRRITSSWDLSGGTTWNNQPSMDTVAQVYVPQTNLPYLDVNADLTRMVNNWLVSGNNGLGMKLNTEVMYNCRIFCSSSYTKANKHPILIITY